MSEVQAWVKDQMDVKKPTTDPYRLHRAALRPLLPGADQEDMAQACKQAASIGETEFLAFLQQQGLASMWDKMIEENTVVSHLSAGFKDSLHQDRLHTTGAYLIQRNKLKTIKSILDDAGIAHAVYKGADTRERYYNEPSLRPAADIDVLVPEEHKIAAIKAFKRQNFEFYATSDNISHEANLVKGKTSIDLHWDIMRPGRTRIPMTDTLLSTRQDHGSHWGMSNDANLFVMLVHPVFTKYATAPQASLMRTVDLAQVMTGKDWEVVKVIQLLETAGLKTAAWITLQWFRQLTHSTIANEAIEKLKPGKLRQKYLNWWLEKNLASRLQGKPVYVQLGFTLPAHDTPTDAIQAVKKQRLAGRNAEEDLKRIEGEIN